MHRSRILALVLLAAPLAAQEADPVYQAPKTLSVAFELDALLRAEWTDGLNTAEEDARQRLQLRPRLELGVGPLAFGFGAEANLSSDDNHPPVVAVQRDNYDSRDLRVDLAWARFEAGNWLRVEGGIFEMPIGFTEMIWDRDLRAQGGATMFSLRERGALKRLSLIGVGSWGGHVFDDGSAQTLAAALEADFGLGELSSLSLTGAFVAFDDLGEIASVIRRQNTRVGGALVREYEVLDAVLRFRHEGAVRVELVADASVNTAVDKDDKGLWLAAVVGSVRSSRLRGEYVYAKVDKDATLAAYGADDFLWVTGWEGHKGDLGVRLPRGLSLHVVGQWQRFKDAPQPAERGRWVPRYRVDLRFRS